jgi:hypothetical protein
VQARTTSNKATPKHRTMHTHEDGECGRSGAVGGDGDAWDDSALVRAYDDAIARYSQGNAHASTPTRDTSSPSSSDARPRAPVPRVRRSAPDSASGERPRATAQPLPRSPPPPHRAASPSRVPYGADAQPYYDPRMFEQRHGYQRPGPQPVYYYSDYDYAPPPLASSSRDEYYHHAPYPPPPPRQYDPYDAYGGEYAVRHPPFEDEFAQFSPFRGSRTPRGGAPPPPHRYPPPPHSPAHHHSPRRAPPPAMGPPRVPPDMTESAYETAHSYADDGYDADELANLLLAWYYAGYYTGSFSRKPDHDGGAH